MTLLGDNLNILRNKLGKKQEEMAEAVGVGFTTWSDYERGKSKPRLEVLIEISEKFHVSIDTLLKKSFVDVQIMENIGQSEKHLKSTGNSTDNSTDNSEFEGLVNDQKATYETPKKGFNRDETIQALKETINALKDVIDMQRDYIEALKKSKKEGE